MKDYCYFFTSFCESYDDLFAFIDLPPFICDRFCCFFFFQFCPAAGVCGRETPGWSCVHLFSQEPRWQRSVSLTLTVPVRPRDTQPSANLEGSGALFWRFYNAWIKRQLTVQPSGLIREWDYCLISQYMGLFFMVTLSEGNIGLSSRGNVSEQRREGRIGAKIGRSPSVSNMFKLTLNEIIVNVLSLQIITVLIPFLWLLIIVCIYNLRQESTSTELWWNKSCLFWLVMEHR